MSYLSLYLFKQALNKKENKGGLGSPDGCGGIDSDGEEIGTTTTLTPRTEEKYNRIDVEFQNMMHRNLLNGNRSVSLLEKFETKYACSICLINASYE